MSVERASVSPIPGVLLAQLAVDQRVQGKGLGRYLFEEALGKTLTLAIEGPVVFGLFVADAIDEDASNFYQRRGFISLGGDYPTRMVLDLKPVIQSLKE